MLLEKTLVIKQHIKQQKEEIVEEVFKCTCIAEHGKLLSIYQATVTFDVD